MFDITSSIVLYNNDRDVLSDTINSFLATTLKVRLYLIDNSPTDSLKDIAPENNVEYIFMNCNRGFGAGHNKILCDATKMGKYHLVLNPDVRFEEGTIEKLYEYMESNTNVGNVMPKILYPSGEQQFLCKLLPTPMDWIIRMFVPVKFVKDKIDYKLEMHFADYDSEMNVPYLSGCFMFLRTTVINEIGCFDEGIFMYGEDTDLNRRIYQKYKTMFYPKAVITHNFEKGSHKSMRLLWIHIKAAIYYLNKWGWFFDKERSLINKKTIRLYSKKII